MEPQFIKHLGLGKQGYSEHFNQQNPKKGEIFLDIDSSFIIFVPLGTYRFLNCINDSSGSKSP
jgi:hypothetical protein